MARKATIGAAVVIALIMAVVAVLWALQRQFIYFPDTSSVPEAGRVIDGAHDVRLETSDGLSLAAWYVPASAHERNITVLVAHGNGGNLAGRASLGRALSDAGFNVLLFDYRGYGGNDGTPSEDGLARDARAAYHYISEDLGVPDDRLLYFGESLGTGVVTELATEHPPAGILLRSPFTDLASMGREHYPYLPVGLLLRESYPVKDYVGRLHMPITVVYGTADDLVPPGQSREVIEAASDGQGVPIDGAGHNDAVMVSRGPVVTAVEDLARRSIE